MKRCLLVSAVVALTALACAAPSTPVLPDLAQSIDGQAV